jgi:hypothetical protein
MGKIPYGSLLLAHVLEAGVLMIERVDAFCLDEMTIPSSAHESSGAARGVSDRVKLIDYLGIGEKEFLFGRAMRNAEE